LNAGANGRRITIPHILKVFIQVSDYFAAPVEGREDVHESEHLDLEMFVAHGERHHALVKTGLAEERLRMFVDQFEDSLTAGFNFGLERAHELDRNFNAAVGLRQNRIDPSCSIRSWQTGQVQKHLKIVRLASSYISFTALGSMAA